MGEKMTAQVKLETGMRFDAASGSGHHVTLDASEQDGGQDGGLASAATIFQRGKEAGGGVATAASKKWLVFGKSCEARVRLCH